MQSDSPELRQQKITALKAVRKALKMPNPNSTFICFLLQDVAKSQPELAKACRKLRKYNSKALYPCGTLGQWRMYNSKVLSPRFPSDNAQARIKWVSWMIKSLKEEQKAEV